MGCLRFLCKWSAYLVVLLAIAVGILASGIPGQLGLYKAIDGYLNSEGNQRFKGFLPVIHQGTPFGFDIKQVPDGSLKGQTFIVTGANVGLGYWTAYHLTSKGGDVVMACRSNKKCEVAKRGILGSLKHVPVIGNIECKELDLGSLTSVYTFAKSFTKKYEKLHSLILNAGVMACPYALTVDGIEQQIATNHFGHFYLTQLLTDVLASTASSSSPTTISVVSSSAHFSPYPEGIKLSLSALNDEAIYDPALAYGQSKLANVLFAQELSERVKDKNILVNAIHPGGVATELGRHIRDKLIKFFPAEFIDSLMKFIVHDNFWSADVASYTQLYVAIGEDIKKKKVTGKYWHPIARETKPHAVHAFNNTLQKEFWKFTEAVLKEKTKNIA